MSYTYTQDVTPTETEAAFVPAYARRSAVKAKKVKTWMVLAPIAGAVLLGGAAIMLLNSGGEAQPQPLAEPAPAPMAASAPALLSSTPEAAPVTTAPMAPIAEPAPVTAREAPARPPIAERRPAPADAARVVEPEITGPQAYEAAPLNSAAPSPRVASTPAPAITVSPLG